MDDCIFCKIPKRETPANIVYEDNDNVSFLNINQSAPGHVMVIPKKHGLSILDYNQEELGKWMKAVQNVAKKLKKAMDCDSITMGINHLERRGMLHLHMHLIPRWEDDGGGIIQTTVHNPPKEDRKTIAEKIANAN